MKLYEFLNKLGNISKNTKIVIRARNYGLNEITDVEITDVVVSTYGTEAKSNLEYGQYEYGNIWDIKRKETEKVIEISFKDGRK